MILYNLVTTMMILFSALLPISAPFQISAPSFECVFVNKGPYFNKVPLLQ